MTPQSAKSAAPENSVSGHIRKDGGSEEVRQSPREHVLAKRLVASYHLENDGATIHLFTTDDTTVIRNGIFAVSERDGLILAAAVVYPMQDGFHAIRYDPDCTLDMLRSLEEDNPGQVIYSPKRADDTTKEYIGAPDIAKAIEPADRPFAPYERDHISWIMHIAMQMTVLDGGTATGPSLLSSSMVRRLLQ